MSYFNINPILLTALASICSGFAIAEPDVIELRTRFDEEVTILDGTMDTLNSKYRGYLEKQKTAFQEAGNLKGMLAVDEELKGFETGAHSNTEFDELSRLQEIYRNQRAAILQQRQEEFLKLVVSYQTKAEELARESTKAGRIEDAKLALAESERFAAMVKDAASRISAPSSVSTTPSSTSGATWSTLLEEAKTSIRKIEDPSIRNRVWRDYARGLANCGNFEEGVLSAKRIGDDEIKGLALFDVAQVLADAGRFEDAISAIKSISSGFRADLGLARVAAIQIERGDMSGAARTAELIRGPAGKGVHSVDLAVVMRSQGDSDGFKAKIVEAGNLAGKLADESEMKEVFGRIAMAQVDAGDLAGAKATANLYRGHRFGSPTLAIIEALAKNGNFKAAHELRGSSGFTKHTGSVSGAAIAEAEAAAGKFQDAKNTAKSISYGGPRSITYAKIAVIEEDLVTARNSAEALFQDGGSGYKEQHEGRALALTGVLQAKKEGLDAAVAWAQQLKHPNLRALALISLAEYAASIR